MLRNSTQHTQRPHNFAVRNHIAKPTKKMEIATRQVDKSGSAVLSKTDCATIKERREISDDDSRRRGRHDSQINARHNPLHQVWSSVRLVGATSLPGSTITTKDN